MNVENALDKLRQNRTGVIVGALIGMVSGGLFGVVFGAGLGFVIERWLRGTFLPALNPQQAFFQATFAVMGKVAKADGRVTEDEIEFARHVMARMKLNESRRREAIDWFTRGKSEEFEIDEVIKPLAVLLRKHTAVKLMLVEIQLQAAMIDGELSRAELAVIAKLCDLLLLTSMERDAVIARMRAHTSYQGEQQGFTAAGQQHLVLEAYGVLGVESSATDKEVKQAYRRLMSQHHPDKLVAKGLPEEMMQIAKEKAQEIQAAYDCVRQARKEGAA